MPKYRKKPVVIEAFEVKFKPRDAFALEPELVGEVPQWFWNAIGKGTARILFGVGHAYVEIRTLEGKMIGDEGDRIIQGVKGELYPCKPDIFAATYEAAD